MMTDVSLAPRLAETGVIVIVRGDFPLQWLRGVAAALVAAGVGLMEITLNSVGALEAIHALQAEVGKELLVGAGTVRTVQDVDRAIGAGASFLVSPNLDADSVQRAREAGITHVPGVFTATEAQRASALGCDLVKLFPVNVVGPGYLKALRAPLDDLGFVAVGGIDEDNLADYVRAGAVAIGVGSSLVHDVVQTPGEIQARAARLVTAYRQARTC